MNEKEIAELRRRFRPDKSGITCVLGCYVNENGEVVSRFRQSLGAMSAEEGEKLLALLKRTLSGTPGRNLLDITFETAQVVDGPEHRRLMALRDSALEDEGAVEDFFQTVIRSAPLEGNYLILLARDTYDVPYRGRDGAEQADASEEVFTYLVCALCPVKQTKPALSYYPVENQLHNRGVDDLLSPPALGFLFPAFDDRSTNLYGALYYTRDGEDNHPDFVEAVFHTPAPMPAQAQMETFQALLGESLEEEGSYEVVQAIRDQLRERVEAYKSAREEEPLAVSRQEVGQVLSACGVAQTHIAAFEQRYDEAFGPGTRLAPQNLLDIRKLEVRTPSVTIQVDPDRGDLVETRVIDGVRYILIRADEGVRVNGVDIQIS